MNYQVSGFTSSAAAANAGAVLAETSALESELDSLGVSASVSTKRLGVVLDEESLSSGAVRSGMAWAVALGGLLATLAVAV